MRHPLGREDDAWLLIMLGCQLRRGLAGNEPFETIHRRRLFFIYLRRKRAENALECAGVLWNTLVCAGVRWCALVCAGVRWCALMCAGVRWCALLCAGVRCTSRPGCCAWLHRMLSPTGRRDRGKLERVYQVRTGGSDRTGVSGPSDRVPRFS